MDDFEEYLTVVGARLKKARRVKGMSTRQLAAASGVHFNTVNDIENGTANPTLRTISRLCDALGVSIKHLLG